MEQLPEFVKEILIAGGVGMPLFRLVMAIVTFFGKMGLHGKAQMISAVIVGEVLGILFLMAAIGVPSTFSTWFWYFVYGSVLSGTAIGVYETNKNSTEKALLRDRYSK